MLNRGLNLLNLLIIIAQRREIELLGLIEIVELSPKLIYAYVERLKDIGYINKEEIRSGYRTHDRARIRLKKSARCIDFLKKLYDDILKDCGFNKRPAKLTGSHINFEKWKKLVKIFIHICKSKCWTVEELLEEYNFDKKQLYRYISKWDEEGLIEKVYTH